MSDNNESTDNPVEVIVEKKEEEIDQLWTKLSPKLNAFFDNRMNRLQPKGDEKPKVDSTTAELNALKKAFEKQNAVIAAKEAKIMDNEKTKLLTSNLSTNGIDDEDLQELALSRLQDKIQVDENGKFFLMINDEAITVEEGVKKLFESDAKLQKIKKASTSIKLLKPVKSPVVAKVETAAKTEKGTGFSDSNKLKPFKLVNGQRVYKD
jgi:hypothetical protein